jgi:PAS domain S-box-containing protein/putative nucleotidyltransferase with HDIG domain
MEVPEMTWERLITDLDNLRCRVMELKDAAEIERQQTDDTLKGSEERFRTLFENAPVCITITRKERILFVNRACASMFGFRNASELRHKPVVECFAPQCRQDIMERMTRRERGEHVSKMYETVGLRKDGSTFPIYIETSVIDLPDGCANVAFISDITERKQIESKMVNNYERLEKSLEQTVKSLSYIVGMRDPCTADHQVRVAGIACEIASELGMPKEQIIAIKTAALVHDIGKTLVPAEILSKPGMLNGLEWSLVHSHVQASYNIVKTIDFLWPVAEIVLQHHERLNGSGYPRGLSGDNIVKEARILAIADVIEAMASDRPYRPAFPLEMALDELWHNKGVLYDPDAVEVCLKLFYWPALAPGARLQQVLGFSGGRQSPTEA